jgi:MFS transporter, PHS family, inorganic phosphate transporter
MMGAVFAMQGIGQFTAAIIALIVVSGFKNSLKTAKSVDLCDGVCQLAVDKMWRVIIGFGAVPGCIALYFRLTIPETPRYTFDVARDSEKAVEDVKAYRSGEREGKPDEVSRAAVLQDSRQRLDPPKASWADFWRHYSQWRHGKVLLGTAGSWFFLGKSRARERSVQENTDCSDRCRFLRSWSQQLDHSPGHWLCQG